MVRRNGELIGALHHSDGTALFCHLPVDERARYCGALVIHHRQLALWNANCPENFGSGATLVATEIARIEGRELDAQRLYEEAIQLAQQYGLVQNEVIAQQTGDQEISVRVSVHVGIERKLQ